MWISGLSFCRNNGWIMEDMDKGLTVFEWVLIPKIPQMSQNLSTQFLCPCPKGLNFNEKRLQWASIVRGRPYSFEWNGISCTKISNTDFRIWYLVQLIQTTYTNPQFRHLIFCLFIFWVFLPGKDFFLT